MLRCFDRNKIHRRALNSFGYGFGIAIVVLMTLQERLHVLRGDKPHIVTKLRQAARYVMGTRTGLHANDTLRDVDKAPHKLCARKLGAHDNSAATVLADQVKRGLANIDADGGDIGE